MKGYGFSFLMAVLVLGGDAFILVLLAQARQKFHPILYKKNVLRPFLPGPTICLVGLTLWVPLAILVDWLGTGIPSLPPYFWLCLKAGLLLGWVILLFLTYDMVQGRVRLAQAVDARARSLLGLDGRSTREKTHGLRRHQDFRF